MLHKNQKSKASAGFTIIEVLIVLAIAGLILLIVFLAVPALQRNSRNTAIKNDVQNVVGGVSEYSGANNGALPTGIVSDDTGTVTYSGATGTNSTTIKVQPGTDVAVSPGAPSASSLQPGQVRVVLKSKCDGNTAVKSNSRAVAAFYLIETTGDPALQCTES